MRTVALIAYDGVQLLDLAGPADAARCGFGSDETMRRAFLRVLGIAPSEYRLRFRQAA